VVLPVDVVAISGSDIAEEFGDGTQLLWGSVLILSQGEKS
jgi:hypothetical protein